MLVPKYSLLEIILRGFIIYLALFALLRIARSRHTGQLGLADILVIVLIADAVSNGMASEYRSIPEGLVLAATIFFWSFLLDWLGYQFPSLRPLLESGPRCLIRDGRKSSRNAIKRTSNHDVFRPSNQMPFNPNPATRRNLLSVS